MLIAGMPASAFGKGGAAGGAAAASYGVMAGQRRHRDLVAFHEFLQQHPETATLKTSPEYAGDPVFVSAWPELQTFLQTHRRFAKRLKRTPGITMAQVARLKS